MTAMSSVPYLWGTEQKRCTLVNHLRITCNRSERFVAHVLLLARITAIQRRKYYFRRTTIISKCFSSAPKNECYPALLINTAVTWHLGLFIYALWYTNTQTDSSVGKTGSKCREVFHLSSTYAIVDVNYIFSKLLNLFLLSNEKGNPIFLRLYRL